MTDKQKKLLKSFNIDPDKFEEIVFLMLNEDNDRYEEIYTKLANSIIDLLTQNEEITVGPGIKEETFKGIFPTEGGEDNESDSEEELKPVGDVMVPSKETPLPKNEPIQVTLKSGESYKGKQITGGLKDLNGLWVLSDKALEDEVKSFRKLSRE